MGGIRQVEMELPMMIQKQNEIRDDIIQIFLETMQKIANNTAH